jgi:hypothetical protein
MPKITNPHVIERKIVRLKKLREKHTARINRIADEIGELEERLLQIKLLEI